MAGWGSRLSLAVTQILEEVFWYRSPNVPGVIPADICRSGSHSGQVWGSSVSARSGFEGQSVGDIMLYHFVSRKFCNRLNNRVGVPDQIFKLAK